MSPYTIVLADDHALFRGGVKRIIKEHADLEVIGEAGDGLELLQLLKKSNPNMVILDISMPNLRGLEATREIKKMYPHIHILLLTMHKKKEFIQQGIAGGADGFLLKEEADAVLLSCHSDHPAGEKIHFASPLPGSGGTAHWEKKAGTPEHPRKRRSYSFWPMANPSRTLPISCSSASIPYAGTGKTS